jgi:prefoldin beta subunit
MSLEQLQAIEQAAHAHAAQRASLQQQLLEIENARKELASAPESYRIIGNIMVKADPATLEKELGEKHERIQTRLVSVERQEKRLREEMQQLQAKILEGKQ